MVQRWSQTGSKMVQNWSKMVIKCFKYSKTILNSQKMVQKQFMNILRPVAKWQKWLYSGQKWEKKEVENLLWHPVKEVMCKKHHHLGSRSQR